MNDLKTAVEALLEQRLDKQHLGGYEHSGCYGRIPEDIVAEEIVELVATHKAARSDEWHPFVVGEHETYPPSAAEYWATWKNGRVEKQHFDIDSPLVDMLWRYCTHWREIEAPVSPNAKPADG